MTISFIFDQRPADSPFVETVWRTRSEAAGTFMSQAAAQWEMVIARHKGETSVTMRGPETKASLADCPPDTEFFGIVFKLGTFMPAVPISTLRDGNDLALPLAANRSFWLQGAVWQLPDYDNADVFLQRMLRGGLIAHDPLIDAALADRPLDLSPRALQYRFVQATGLTQITVRQIRRAQQAVTLLRQGMSIVDTTYATGYFDQAHLNRALRRFIGQTPAQVRQAAQPPDATERNEYTASPAAALAGG